MNDHRPPQSVKKDLVLLTGCYPDRVRDDLLNAVASLDYKILPADIGAFKSGERFCELYPQQAHLFAENNAEITGANVHVVLHMNDNSNEFFVDAVNTIATVKEYGANNVHVIMPFAPYARQDRPFDQRFTSLMAKNFPKHLKCAGADRVTTLDVHSKAAENYYIDSFGENNVTFLSMAQALGQAASELFPAGTRYVYGGPDGGDKPDDLAQKRAHDLRNRRHGWTDYPSDRMFYITKRHKSANETEVVKLTGDVAGQTAMLLDDMVDTCGTTEKAVTALEKNDVDAVAALATHPVLSGNSLDDFTLTLVKQHAKKNFFVTADTILSVHDKFDALPTQEQKNRVKIVSTVPMIKQALARRLVV